MHTLKLALSLTLISISLVLFGLKESSGVLGNYGVLDAFSPLFFIGFGVLLVGFVVQFMSRSESKTLMVIQVILAEAYLWLIPAFWLPGLIFPASGHDLFFYTTSTYIVNTGHLNAVTYIYQSWPGPYLLTATILELLSPLSYLQLARVTPFILNLIVSAFLYVFIRSQISNHGTAYSLLGVIIFELFNFTEQLTTLSPFSGGSVFYYSYVLLILSLVTRKPNAFGSKQLTIVVVLVSGALAITHPLIGVEAQMAIMAVLVFSLTRKHVPFSTAVPIMLLPPILIGAFGFFFPSQGFWSGASQSVAESLSHFVSALFGGTVQSYQSTSTYHVFINDSKLFVFLFLVAMAAPAFLKGLVTRNERSLRLFYVLMGLSIAAVLVAGAQGTNYNAYFIAAVLPVIVLFDVLTLSMISHRYFVAGLFILLAVSVPVSFVVLYGNVISESPSQATIVASDYYSVYVPPTSLADYHTMTELVIVGFFGPNINTIDPYTNPGAGNLSSLDNPNTQFVVLGSDAAAIAQYAFGNSTLVTYSMSMLESQPQWQLIYSSNLVTMYQKE